jgi:hypothetical protein
MFSDRLHFCFFRRRNCGRVFPAFQFAGPFELPSVKSVWKYNQSKQEQMEVRDQFQASRFSYLRVLVGMELR